MKNWRWELFESPDSVDFKSSIVNPLFLYWKRSAVERDMNSRKYDENYWMEKQSWYIISSHKLQGYMGRIWLWDHKWQVPTRRNMRFACLSRISKAISLYMFDASYGNIECNSQSCLSEHDMCLNYGAKCKIR